MAFSEHPHESHAHRRIAEVRDTGTLPAIPSRIEELITGASFVGACQGCRNITHVISHHASR